MKCKLNGDAFPARPAPWASCGSLSCREPDDCRVVSYGPVNATQETQELPGAVAGHAFPDDQSRLDVQSGEECGGSMARVVESHRRV